MEHSIAVVVQLAGRDALVAGSVGPLGMPLRGPIRRPAAEVREAFREAVEGLLEGGALHPIQAAFKEEHGLQCGFCTPGMMLVGSALIARNPDPTDDDVRWAISGQICRCTGYMNIVKAIQAAAKANTAASEPASA